MIILLIAAVLLTVGGLGAFIFFAVKDWKNEELQPNVTFAGCCAAVLVASCIFFVSPVFEDFDILTILFGNLDRDNQETLAILFAFGSAFAGLAAPFSRIRAGYVLPVPGLILCLLWLLTASFMGIS